MNGSAGRVGQLRCTVVEPAGRPTRAIVVILHGYGMRPEDLSPFAHSLQLEATCYLPEAPLRAEDSGRAWWPIDQDRRAAAMAAGPRDLAAECPAGVGEAHTALSKVLDEVQRRHQGIPLILVGFSQGGMLACDYVLRHGAGVAALGLLSASRISADEWNSLSPRLAGLPVLVSHGAKDPDLSFQAGEALRDLCLGAGGVVTWVPFEGGHEIPLVVWRALRKFIREIAG